MKTWRILELEPTCDEKMIKRAYAERLKTCHPEDDAEAYQVLREAYENALYLARIRFEEDEDDEDDEDDDGDEGYQAELLQDGFKTASDEVTSERLEIECPEELKMVDSEINHDYEVQRIIERMESLYADYAQRIQITQWEALLSEDVFWRLESKERLFWLATEALLDMPHMPSEIWLLIESHLHWLDREKELSYHLGEEVAGELLGRTKEMKPFIYPSAQVLGDAHEVYFEKLDAIYRATKTLQLEMSAKLLEEAMQQHSNDPNFHLMYGEYALYADKYIDRYNHFKHVKVLCPDNVPMRLYMAKLLLRANMDSQSIEDYEELIKLAPDNIEALLSLSEGYMKVGRVSEGYKMCMKMVTSHPHDSRVFNHANRMIRFLIEKLSHQPFSLGTIKMIRELSDKTGAAYPREQLGWPFRAKRMAAVMLKLIGLAFASVVLLGLIFCGHIFGILVAWHVGRAIFKRASVPGPSFGS